MKTLCIDHTQWLALGGSEEITRACASIDTSFYAVRIAAEHKGGYEVLGFGAKVRAQPGLALRKLLEADARERPVVGDWVALDSRGGHEPFDLVRVLPRQSLVQRKAAGREALPQALAANIDCLWIVMSLNEDFNVRRLERYLSIAYDADVKPVVVLSKADLCDDAEAKVGVLSADFANATFIIVSTVTGVGIERLKSTVKEGQSAALVGSSGVGKSSLVNAILSRTQQAVAAIRTDGKGRHTTTHRELMLLPEGGVLIDTPGMREVGVWAEHEGIAQSFEDLATLALSCKFSDCAHRQEPHCALRKAVDEGVVTRERLESYQRLREEASALRSGAHGARSMATRAPRKRKR